MLIGFEGNADFTSENLGEVEIFLRNNLMVSKFIPEPKNKTTAESIGNTQLSENEADAVTDTIKIN